MSLPKMVNIFGFIDSPTENQITNGILTIRGWVLKDSDAKVEMEFRIGNKAFRPSIVWNPRDDVITDHPDINASFNPTPGFRGSINTWGMADGRYVLICVAQIGNIKKG